MATVFLTHYLQTHLVILLTIVVIQMYFFITTSTYTFFDAIRGTFAMFGCYALIDYAVTRREVSALFSPKVADF